MTVIQRRRVILESRVALLKIAAQMELCMVDGVVDDPTATMLTNVARDVSRLSLNARHP